tara:strand:+ start:1545 stop:2075 length:531 start_codon:yes stop_codon:yes gene_type:complete
MNTTVLNLLYFSIPALITGALAYFLLQQFFKNEESRRENDNYNLKNIETTKESLPIRLQAYERMSLYLERISPNNLLLRVSPITDDSKGYENLLIQNIEQEFEHNLAQQIYLTDDCWNVINTSKNGVIKIIRKSNLDEKIKTADKLREAILKDMVEKPSPTLIALSYIRNEVSKLW